MVLLFQVIVVTFCVDFFPLKSWKLSVLASHITDNRLSYQIILSRMWCEWNNWSTTIGSKSFSNIIDGGEGISEVLKSIG